MVYKTTFFLYDEYNILFILMPAITSDNSITEWCSVWNNLTLENADLVDDPTQPLDSFKLPLQEWVSLNCVRTGIGRCGFSIHQ